jgi:heterodisulfide reductase subunit B
MLEMTKDVLLSAKAIGADCIVTPCPMCHFNLDAKQEDVEGRFDLKIDMPILYFTQLMGIAFGLNPKELGLGRNVVSLKKILDMIKTPIPAVAKA